jgi:hypothetical protein
MTADTHLPEVVSPEEWLAARKELLVIHRPRSGLPYVRGITARFHPIHRTPTTTIHPTS